MGRFFSGNMKSCGAIGDNRLIAAVSLSEQGCSGRRSDLAMRSSIHALWLFWTRSAEQPGLTENVDTAFVTFTVYECDKGGKADAAPAERVPQRLQSSHAGSRVVLKDGLRISPLRRGQWAECDAGKGAMELAAGSLASKKYIRGMHGMSAVAACLG
ncbi:hypothetical protein [Rhizobium leguminosarum]|uniref:hypothetical protein n=1 Tax=Rhizobium leguminosarum TaxID=384 RepID=UPI001C95BE28|nr:hypothetical protein [Rhizobium leguminosarum]MBY5520615.1 hypothetical protein [Rhizobium leguminosarum]MBY5560934.1 hypothetical protein [Rhizobium leguminosarum]MBY5624534.1 hypothetical protein [Rhizobium leguminosarum]MBY5704226.1 hypothetical protein [Rhizobium leguminosarum]MBY5713221.1 hypothetical protein [Rhizobium leguminosarum]